MGDLALFLPLIIVLGAFMFFASRRQKKAMQATIDLHESLAIGDRIHTTSGLEGTITGISDSSIDLEIAPGVITTWMKLAVRDRIDNDDDDDDDDDYEDDDVDAIDDGATPSYVEEKDGSTAYDVQPSVDPARPPKTDS